MDNFSISLFSSLANNIDFNNYERDFTFILGLKNFKVNRLQADLISPKVNELHITDSTQDSFFIDFDNNDIDNSSFNDIISLSNGKTIEISDENISDVDYFLLSIGRPALFGMFPEDGVLTKQNALKQLILKDRLSMNHEIEVTFVASHFYMYNNSESNEESNENNELSRLEVDTLYEIMDYPDFCIENEEVLFRFIYDMSRKDEKYSVLFEFVEFGNLGESFILMFLNVFPIESMNSKIWESFKKFYFSSSKAPKPASKDEYAQTSVRRYFGEESYKNYRRTVFPYKNIPFHGIIFCLQKRKKNENKCKNNNNNDNNYLDVINPSFEIKASSCLSNNNKPENAIDYIGNNDFASGNFEDQWLSIDFMDKLVEIKGYALKSCEWDAGNEHLRNWVIEGTDDQNGLNWIELDKRIDEKGLNGKNLVCYFSVDKVMKCRMVRIRSSGQNWANNHFLAFANIEFFGNLYSLDTK